MNISLTLRFMAVTNEYLELGMSKLVRDGS